MHRAIETQAVRAASRSDGAVLFLSKATSVDGKFARWLALTLEAAGYSVFADMLALEPRDLWHRQITSTLQTPAIKFLLCFRDSALAASGILEEIEIASDLTKELNDPRFIFPLRQANHASVGVLT